MDYKTGPTTEADKVNYNPFPTGSLYVGSNNECVYHLTALITGGQLSRNGVKFNLNYQGEYDVSVYG